MELINSLRRHNYFVIIYGALFLIFLWPLLLFKKTFLFGDYWLQFYPWSYYYAEHLRSGHLPYWTHGVACGFPLIAEGQVAAYYLPHLIAYAILPFFQAYTLSIPLHVLLGGIGFYLYAQKIGMNKEGATLSAILFSFSSSYGGCFYTTGTLRVLSWLPWSLLVIEMMTLSAIHKRWIYAGILSMFVSQMVTAGFPQLAVYAVIYLTCIVGLRSERRRLIFPWFAALALGILLSLPQVFSTLELARVSVRQRESVSFAMWGSVPPPAFISLIFPAWGNFLKVSFYIGILPFLLILIQPFFKKSATERIHWWMVALFSLLALGKFNPVYSFLVEKFSLTALRNPSKFLFFVSTSLAIITGFAFDKILTQKKEITSHAMKKYLATLAGAVLILPALLSTAVHFFKPRLIKAADQYAKNIFFQKTDPVHDLSYYRSAMERMIGGLAHLLSYANLWNVWAIADCLVSTALILLAVNQDSWRRRMRWLVPLLVTVDLSFFSFCLGTGFIGNARPLEKVDVSLLARTLKFTQTETEGAWVEFSGDPSKELIPASSNLYYGLSHRGGYSPLLIKRYYELTKELGIVDSSLGRHPFSRTVWYQEKRLLDALGVQWILSDVSMDLPGTTLLGLYDHHYLYNNVAALPLVYAVFNFKKIPDREKRLLYLKSSEFNPRNEAVVEQELAKSPVGTDNKNYQKAQILSKDSLSVDAWIQMDKTGLVIFQNAFYPRWKVMLDGKKEVLMPVNHAMSGVWVDAGIHRLKFYYDLTPERWCQGVSLVLWTGLIIFMCFQYRRNNIVE